MSRLILTLLVILSLLLASCGSAGPSNTNTGTLKVVATFSILGDLVQNIAGDKIELRTLVGPDADTHTFEPSPADGAALAEAQIVFENGLGLEAWLNDLYVSSGSQAKRVVVTASITPDTFSIGAEAGEIDPHVWQNPIYTLEMVKSIRDALISVDGPNAAIYTANAENYLTQLNELDQSIAAQVDSLPDSKRKLVTNHDALGYFAARYGFEIVGTALGSISTEAGEASAADLARLVEEVKSAGVPVIFTENVENSKIIEQVASEAGVVVGPPLYTDALGQPDTEGDSYLNMMRYNAATIVTALSR